MRWPLSASFNGSAYSSCTRRVAFPRDVDVFRIARAPARHDRDVVDSVCPPPRLADPDLDFHMPSGASIPWSSCACLEDRGYRAPRADLRSPSALVVGQLVGGRGRRVARVIRRVLDAIAEPRDAV